MLYPEGGKFHVSLAIPGQQSKICKGIGMTASANFLIPTIEYIIRCAVEGDLGIADTIKKNKAVQYLNKCSSPQTLKQFSKSFGVSIEGDPEQYRRNGRYNIPESAVSLSQISDPVSPTASSPLSLTMDMDSGLKMIEKATIKSILEQYKPWIEIAKLLIQHLAQIEDIIARTTGLIGPSAKPKGNAGNSNRPKALGYGGATDMKKSIGKMESLAKKKPGFFEKSKVQSAGFTQSGATFSGIQSSNDSPGGNGDKPSSTSYDYKIISTVYSTGAFIEGIDYEYQYIDIPDDEKISADSLDDSLGNLGTGNNIDFDDNDPYKGKRPKTIIFGIYDSKGNPINPEDPIRIPKYNPDGSLSINQGQVEFVGNLDVGGEAGIQTIQKADWISRTGRWYGHFNRKGVTYLWRHKNNRNVIKPSGSNPQVYDNGWVDGPYEQLFYKDPKNLEINRENNIIEGGNIGISSQYIGSVDEGGDPEAPVYYFTTGEQDAYKEIFNDIVDRKFAKATELSSEEKVSYKAEIMSNVDTQSHLESIGSYGFFSSIFQNGVTNPPVNKGLTGGVISTGIPSNMRNSFMPKKIRVGNEDVWIDPESDYEMKIIKVDPSSKVRFSDTTANGPQEFEAEILRFVKNSIEITINGGSTFDVDIIRNTNVNPSSQWQPYIAFQTAIPGRYEGLSQFTIDNWDYKGSDNDLSTADEVRYSGMSMLLRVTSDTPPPFWASKVIADNDSAVSAYTWTNNGNYILGVVNNKWKIARYEESTNAGQSLTTWSTQEVSTIDINDPIVSRVKVKNLGTAIWDNDIIIEWYYNNKWNTVPPSTWQISPQFETPNTIIDYNVTTSGIQGSVIGDVGQRLTGEVINYNISGYKYNNIIATTQPSFGLTGSTASGAFIQRYKMKVTKKTLTREFKSINFDNDISEFVNLNIRFGTQVGKFRLDDGTYAYFDKTNYNLLKWEYLLFDSTKTSFSNGVTGRTTNTNIDRLPLNTSEKRNWVIDYNNIGNNNTDTPLVTTNGTIPPNQIRLKETDNPFGRLLDPRKITNRHLAEENPLINKYSNGMYGHSEADNKQTIEQIYRYMKSEFDVETYYIVEGVLADDNTQTGNTPASNASGTGSGSGGGGYYKKPHALGAIKVFISVLSDIFSKLIPAIKRLISLFKNPANFIVEIIKEKLGESTKIFSPEFINDYQQMLALPKIQRREFVRSSSLRDYVYVNPVDGEHRVLFDGAAIKKLGPLFGATLTFGIEVKKALPKLIFKIDLAKMTSDSLDSILKGTAKNNNLSNINTNTQSNQPASTTPSSSGNKASPVNTTLYGEEVSITYSTGKYIEGVQYQYIYVTEYVSRLIKEGDELAESNDPEQMNLAFSKYDEALKSDPNNELIKDRISSLMNKIPNYVQPIMEFLLSLVSGPLKLVADVVQFIMDFFTKLKLPKLPTDVPKFLSFAWLIKEGEYGWSSLKGGFFTPGVIFKTFGLDVLPLSIPGITPPDWTPAAGIFATYLSGAIPDMPGLKKETIPPGMPVVNQPPGPLSNFNNAMSLAFLPFMKTPTVNNTVFPVGASKISKDHILTWFKKNPRMDYQKFKLIGIPPILELVMQFICFIEAIINSIIDLFWSILGLEVLIPPPHINICKKFKGNNMSPQDIMDLLNGDYKDNLKSGDSTDTDGDGKPDYDFIYDIKTSDGKSLRELNREDLQRWLDDNRDYEFEFLFNE